MRPGAEKDQLAGNVCRGIGVCGEQKCEACKRPAQNASYVRESRLEASCSTVAEAARHSSVGRRRAGCRRCQASHSRGAGHDDDVAGHIAGQGDVASKFKRFCVVHVNLVPGAIDEDFRAIRGEAERKTIAALKFLFVDELARFHIESPKLATAIPGSSVDGDGVTDGTIGSVKKWGH